MQRVRLGRTDLQVSPLALGSWELSGAWGKDISQGLAAVRRALDLGINFFDTAHGYGWGESEDALARGLGDLTARQRDDLVLLTKGGIANVDGGYQRNSDPDFLRSTLEQSLKRLKTDRVDLFLIHWPDPVEAFDDTARVLHGFVRDGLTRHVGVSNFSVEQMRSFALGGAIAAASIPYSLVRSGAESDLFPYCQEQGIAVLGHAPLAHGLLSGAMPLDGRFADDDWRSKSSQYRGPAFEAKLAVARQLSVLAERRGVTVAQLALAWTRAHPAGVIPIVGAQIPAHIESCVAALDIHLDAAEAATLARIGAQAPELESAPIPTRAGQSR